MFIVIETQTDASGNSITVLENNSIPTYASEEEALNKFYIVCSYAVTAHLPKHAVTVMTEEHQIVKSEIFKYPRTEGE